MSLSINTNVPALNTARNATQANRLLAGNIQKLSTGKRINSAADDAAGLAIREKLASQIRGLDQASKNVQTAKSLFQVAEGGMQSIQDILQRQRELAVNSATDTNLDDTERAALDLEYQALIGEIGDISSTANFNTQKLLDGTFTGKKIQVGANASDQLTVSIDSMSASTLSISGTAITSQSTATAAITSLDNALKTVSMSRAKLGAMSNRLDYKLTNLETASENTSSAKGIIEDTDMALEMSKFVKNSVLAQAAQAMLAQANSLPQSVLSLIG